MLLKGIKILQHPPGVGAGVPTDKRAKKMLTGN